MVGRPQAVFYWTPTTRGWQIDIGASSAAPWVDESNTGACVGCHSSNAANPALFATARAGGGYGPASRPMSPTRWLRPRGRAGPQPSRPSTRPEPASCGASRVCSTSMTSAPTNNSPWSPRGCHASELVSGWCLARLLELRGRPCQRGLACLRLRPSPPRGAVWRRLGSRCLALRRAPRPQPLLPRVQPRLPVGGLHPEHRRRGLLRRAHRRADGGAADGWTSHPARGCKQPPQRDQLVAAVGSHVATLAGWPSPVADPMRFRPAEPTRSGSPSTLPRWLQDATEAPPVWFPGQSTSTSNHTPAFVAPVRVGARVRFSRGRGGLQRQGEQELGSRSGGVRELQVAAHGTMRLRAMAAQSVAGSLCVLGSREGANNRPQGLGDAGSCVRDQG